MQIIYIYEEGSGKCINVDKLEVVFSWYVQSNCKWEILGILQIGEVDYYVKYLGLPTILGRSKKAAFGGLKERV